MEESNPLVSIVIPVHNGERYIKEAIDSCISQTYQNIEIVVVDDKSEDGTLDILKEYKDRVKVIPVEKQNGLGNVINIGIKKSKGKYIARMDSDDVMYPTRIEKQVKHLESNTDVVAVGGQIDIIDSIGNITGHREYGLTDTELKRKMFLFQPFAHPAVMLRKEAVERVGLYPENIWKVEDVKFFFLLSLEGRFSNLQDTVLKYRVTFSTESQSKMLDHFRKTNEVRKWAKKELGIKPSLYIFLLWKLQCLGVYILNILPPKLFMKTFEFFRKVV